MSSIRVGVHNGSFHADDVFAVAALKLFYRTYFPQPIEIEVVRSRDLAVLATCDVRVDVGGKYSDRTRDYDHHQQGGAGVRKWNNISYASFGLVWKHYGKRICKENGEIAHLVDDHLVCGIDARDNGVNVNGKDAPISVCSVSDMILTLNPIWDEEQDFDSAFDRAVDLALLILERAIARNRGIVQAKPVVAAAVRDAADPRLIVLPRSMPWQKPLLETTKEALFVVYFASDSGDWRLQAVPKELRSMDLRKELPEAWAGLTDDALVNVTGVEDAIFCHRGRFTIGAKSKEGVLKLAALALES